MKNILDWSDYENSGMGDAYADIPKQGGSFAKAVAVCINSKHCETKPKGVMCPSYRVSDNPLLSTGGRVRLLKSALNSSDPLEKLTEEELQQAMALCVSCKGCKRECENEVDMAMIKIEYLAQKNQLSGVSWRTRLFANMPDILSRFPLSRMMIALQNNSSVVSAFSKRFLGISDKRELPLPSKKTFFKRFQMPKSDSAEYLSAEKQVVLFIDTFTQNFEPQNAQAAKDVLEKAGYTVHVLQANDGDKRPLCCGRTHLAHGLVDKTKTKARRVLNALQPYVEKGIPIVGLEPACLLAIRDDYKYLGLGDAAVRTAKLAVLFEEFIAKEVAAKRFDLPLKSLGAQRSPTLIHGHCHQKAVGAMKSMRKVLKLIPDFKFQLIESSCCGMAGSFGLEKEHSEYSNAMAELSLLPTIRDNPDSDIIANGFSCRHQIKDNTYREAVHIAVLLKNSVS